MTYRPKRRGKRVRTTPGPGGGEKQPVASQAWPLDCVTSRVPPADRYEGCEVQKWGKAGMGGGALQLKRLSSWKPKRHYLLTWRCPQRGGVKAQGHLKQEM